MTATYPPRAGLPGPAEPLAPERTGDTAGDAERPAGPDGPTAQEKAGLTARKAVKPLSAVDAALVARYDAMLMERILAALAAGSRPRLYLSSARSDARLLGIEGADVLVVETLRQPVRFKIEWKKLALDARRSLALGLLREGTAEDHALVAFYSLAIGDRGTADAHLARAGEAADAVRAAFE